MRSGRTGPWICAVCAPADVIPWEGVRPVGMTANFGFAVSDRQLSFSQVTNPLTGETGRLSNNGMENRWVGGVSLQWSGPYVRERGIDLHVPEFVKRLTPLVELAWSSPASSPSNVGPQYLLGSGVFYTVRARG